MSHPRFYSTRRLAYCYAAAALAFTALASSCWASGGILGVIFAVMFAIPALYLAIHFGLTWPFVKPGQREAWVEVVDDGVVMFGAIVPWDEMKSVRLEVREPSFPPMHFIELVLKDEFAKMYGDEAVRLDVLRCEGTTPEKVYRAVAQSFAEMQRKSAEAS